ncbi:hypothetical protein MRX96_017836 [Rhipicephalus microplus]|uniref:Putative group i salivary lipocalin n=1 Tax=Rhipicephalus microplus TaxID=6941 RepID=A0A6G5A7K5_RHIMP|nr:uncharacterized protein LOC119167443 [Rhipicephalus microplus]
MAGLCSAAMYVIVILNAMFCEVAPKAAKSVNNPYNFTEFFKPPQFIWTYRSSWNAEFTCERFTMKNISGKSVVVETKFTLYNRTYKHTTQGTLYNVWGLDSYLNMLSMRDYWGDSLTKEIVYASNGYNCAVLQVERFWGWPPVTFDLIVKKSQLNKGPSEDCIQRYNEEIGKRRIGDTNRTVYIPECRKKKKNVTQTL